MIAVTITYKSSKARLIYEVQRFPRFSSGVLSGSLLARTDARHIRSSWYFDADADDGGRLKESA